MQSKYSEAGDAKVGVWLLEKYEGDQVLGVGRPLQVVGFVNDRG